MFVYKDMIAKIRDFVKDQFQNIILFVIIVLLIMLAFSIGYIAAKYQSKEPIKIEYKK
jgi:predicted negative regulator of RcsB-dependent stress response